jgi:hypothetical protein
LLIGFDSGFNLAYTLARSPVKDPKDFQETVDRRAKDSKFYLPPTLSFGDISEGVDHIYDDPANLILPIVEAMEIFAYGANGATRSQVDTKLAAFRKRNVDAVEEELKKSSKGQ